MPAKRTPPQPRPLRRTLPKPELPLRHRRGSGRGKTACTEAEAGEAEPAHTAEAKDAQAEMENLYRAHWNYHPSFRRRGYAWIFFMLGLVEMFPDE